MKPQKPRALVVEDDPSWQGILAENLTDAGLVVDVADNLDLAVSFLRAAPHRLAVVDLSLQGDDPHNEDGLRVLDSVRKLDPGCKTILLTGFATVELAVNVLTEYKALSCLRKEAFQRSQFRELVHQALSSAPTPAARVEKPEPASFAEKQADFPRASGLALIVEDDAGWRGILSELLLDAGLQLRLSRSFGEALGYLRREKFNLAILDLSLSGDDIWEEQPDGHELEGYRLIESARGMGVPVVVVSGVGSLNDIERLYKEGNIYAYVEKQAFDRRAFLAMIHAAQQAGKEASELDSLSDREREVLDLLARGSTNKEIADRLVISENTVKRHLKSIFRKLDIHTRSAAAAFMAQRSGIND
jgi:DNA-binding NarL/FixJ family response regulator